MIQRTTSNQFIVVPLGVAALLAHGLFGCSGGENDDIDFRSGTAGAESDATGQAGANKGGGNPGGSGAIDMPGGAASTGGVTSVGTAGAGSTGGSAEKPWNEPDAISSDNSMPDRTCKYDGPNGVEYLEPGTTVWFEDCTACICGETQVRCTTAYCETPQLPCGELLHGQSRLTPEGMCTSIERCSNGQITTQKQCPDGEVPADDPPPCREGDKLFNHGERVSDNADAGACYCLYGKRECVF